MGSFLHANADGFHWVSGIDIMKTYKLPKQDDRNFCSNCESWVPVLEKDYRAPLKIRIFVRWQGGELFKSAVYTQFIATRPRILKSSTTPPTCK